MPTETFGEWFDRVFPGVVPPNQVFTDGAAAKASEPSLPEEDRRLYLVVVDPPRPKKIEGSMSVVYSPPPAPTVRWISAFDEEEAVQKANAPLGAKVHVAERVNVATFEIPETPTPVRA